MQEVIAGIAILVGIALGYWIRTISTKAEKALLEQRTRPRTRQAFNDQLQVAARLVHRKIRPRTST